MLLRRPPRAVAGRASTRDRLSLGNRVHRLEDVAQVDDEGALHRPRRGVGAAAEPLARGRLEVLTRPGDGLRVGLADRRARALHEVEPRRAKAWVPATARRSASDRPRHAAAVGHRLLEAREQWREAVRGIDPRGGRAAQVQAAALARLAQDGPGVRDVLVELARALRPPLRVLALAALPSGPGDVAEQRAEAIVDHVDLPRRGAIAQRRPDQEVDEQPDDDAAQRVDEARPDHARIGAVAGEQDDERRRGRAWSTRRAAGASSRRSARPGARRRGPPR